MHTFIDNDVQNGRTYYYALVAYDHGDEEKDIFPSENSKFISVLPTGEIVTDQNTAFVTPSSTSAGYSLNDTIPLIHKGPGTGSIKINIVDQKALTGHSYQVEFYDTSSDEIDNDKDWNPLTDDVGSDGIAGTNDQNGSEGNGNPDQGEPNFDWLDDDEYMPVTTLYSVKNLEKISEIFTPNDTFAVQLMHKNIIEGTVEVKNNIGNTVSASDYTVNNELGRIRAALLDRSVTNKHTITFNYYPIYKNPYIQQSVWNDPKKLPYVTERLDSDVFDGLSIEFKNDWFITSDDENTYWWTTNDGNNWVKNDGETTHFFIVSATDLDVDFNGSIDLKAIRVPNKYAVVFSDKTDFGQSYASLDNFSPGTRTNFKVVNLTDNIDVPFYLFDYPLGPTGKINAGDYIYFYDKDSLGIDRYTWNVTFTNRQSQGSSTSLDYGDGDTLFIDFSKPFRSNDTYTFTSPVPEIDQPKAVSEMNDIKVVPNPYIVGHRFEAPLPPGITSGRGNRKIEFQNLPSDGKVHIFSSRGQHVRTLTHSGNMFSGTISWDLKTKENLDIAFGVYYYIVESKIGGKSSGKLAVIK